jgi:glycosyltransferase involved in cell wall biosynthesis
MESAEAHYLQSADHVLAVSETDRDAFLEILKEPAKLTIVPTGVDVDYFRPRSGEEISNSLVFTGSMDWLPNEDGIFFFVKEVLPRVRQEIPDVSLTVVGRSPSARLKELADQEKNIQLTGWVEDVRSYLARGAVCIVPLRIGGGTRLKIFEAMAMAKPVISTTIGAEGLPVKPGESILLADSPQDLARETVRLLRNPKLRDELGLAAHKMVSDNYTWARVAAGFAEVLEQVASKSAQEDGRLSSTAST